MGQRKKDTHHPRLERTSWAWVWLDPDQMPIHQTPVQGFIVGQRRRLQRDERGEYGEWWVQVLTRTAPGAEPFALWLPEHQLKPEGVGWEPPLYPSDRSAAFDSVASRRWLAAQRRGR